MAVKYSEEEIIQKLHECLGRDAHIITGKKLRPFNISFRGKTGHAILAVAPRSLTELYQLIHLFNELKVGYLLQGANTALKGQSTPHCIDKSVVIIRTYRLNKFKILDLPDSSEYKAILVEPGLALKDLEQKLNQLDYDLPHKIGSHDFGNTFGGSCAIGCGGVRVDNLSGAPAKTQLGTLGVISLSARGIFYNGIFKSTFCTSGQELLEKIDANLIKGEDILLPDINALPEFLASLFRPKSYPITNHLHENIFSGQGYEGRQAILLMMYIVRKKIDRHKTFALSIEDPAIKSTFYHEVILSLGPAHPDNLPILCESMSSNLVAAILKEGVTYLAVLFLALAPRYFTRHYVKLLYYRKQMLHLVPKLYLAFETHLGKVLSKLFTPKKYLNLSQHELIIIQVAERPHLPNNIVAFTERLNRFITLYPRALRAIDISRGSFEERFLLQLRNAAALTTLTLAKYHQGVLLAFDDAIMPGAMTEAYCKLFAKRFALSFPDARTTPYLYAHDLKQICHNDWVITANHPFTDADLQKIYALQYQTIVDAEGIPHAEHGIGDQAATDLNFINLARLIAHRQLNDLEGLANPGGAFERAYQTALKNVDLNKAALELIKQSLDRELNLKTLFTYNVLASRNDFIAPLHSINEH